MKRYWYLLVGIVLQVGAVFILPSPNLSAAACENIENFGAVRLQVPELPYTGEYALWVRMQNTEPNAEVLIELNQTDCFSVQATSVSNGEWQWVDFQRAGKREKIRLDQKEKHSLKIIGKSQGLKIDSVTFTDPLCIPHELGNNCHVNVKSEPVGNSEIVELPSLSQGEVSGKVYLSKTPEQFASQLESVSYTVKGKTLQQSKIAEPFDTTLLEDGIHSVLITTRLTNGAAINETIDISVENPNNVLSPFIRWVRLRERSVLIIAVTVASFIVALSLGILLRRWYIRRRERHFHGF